MTYSLTKFPRAFLLDMDGILYHGSKRLPYVLEFLDSFSSTPKLFITNNPIRSPNEVCQGLYNMGIKSITAEQIITSAIATRLWLTKQKTDYSFYAIGASALHKELAKSGTSDSKKADYVIVGEGEGLDYQSLTIGINLISKQGATLVATNPDTSVDSFYNNTHLILPGGGALVAPFAQATGVKPIFIGKPEPYLYNMALQQLQLPAESCLMIGDRPDTDIQGAALLNMKTALVRSGRFLAGDSYPEDLKKPDIDCNDLQQLTHELQQID